MPTAGNNTYRWLLRQGERLLRRRARPAPCEDAAFDAFLLLEKVTGISRTAYPLKKNDSPTAEERAEYLSLLRRRAAGEPVQYLLGEWEFMGLPLYVGPGVLIPRPETELLVEQSLELLRGRPNPRILELCGGSGCISIALAKARPDAEITCLELSAQALCYLRRNIARHGVPNLTAVEGDALSPPPEIVDRYDAILSNPPYIAAGQLPALQREVRQEPAMALDGGPAIEKLTPHILRHTFCSNLVRQGMDVKSVQYLMGHASAGVTLDVYSHINYTDIKEKMLDIAS